MSEASALERIAGEVAGATWAKPAGSVDELVLYGCLTRAWSTELLLAMGRRLALEDELLRLTNSWAVVQVYYAAYGATQALLVAEGKQRPTSHPATQRQAVDLWVTRSAAAAPWSFAIASIEVRQAAHDGSINGPGRPIREAHPWSGCDPHSCWDIGALALRSTREDAVKEALIERRKRKLADRRRAWQEEERTRLGAGRSPRKPPPWPSRAQLAADETADVRSKVRPYTLLDYLYRLRIKANYEDATVFIEGPEDEFTSVQVADDLGIIAAATMLAHELRVGQLIGRAALLTMVDGWLASHTSGEDIALAARRDLLRASL